MKRTPSQAGVAAVDAWSVAHVASGWVLARGGLSPGGAFLLLATYEILEAQLRKGVEGGGGVLEYESPANVAADLVAGMAGYYAGRR